MAWWMIFVWIGIMMAADLLRPKPDIEDARPGGLGDFQFPTATEGRAVPLVWGTVRQNAPNVIWYGDLRNVALTQEVKTGLFSSDDVVTGYEYYIGMDFALCRGPGVERGRIWVNDKIADIGAGGISGTHVFLVIAFEWTESSIRSSCTFYDGDLDTQATNAYLVSKLTTIPAYRGLCHVVFEGGYIGNRTSIAPWAFELMRIPNGLGLAPDDARLNQAGTVGGDYGDANPMNVLFEILTDTEWGLAIDVGQIDAPNFVAVAEVLATENNGFSMLLDNELQATALINEIQRQIDGLLYFDREVGLWRVKLARDDYDVGTIPSLDESNVVRLNNYARQSWSETTNQVRVRFADRTKEYKQTYAAAMDMANAAIQQSTVPIELQFPGIKDAALANAIAWRELRTYAYPLAKIELTITRRAYNFKPGDVFKFSWPRLGIVGMVFRVSKITSGALTEGEISLSAIQDIFSAGVGSFSDPVGTGWGNPYDEVLPPVEADTLVLEAPRQMVAADTYNATLEPRIWAGARAPGGGTTAMHIYIKAGTSRPIGGVFSSDAPINRFLLVSALDADIPAYGTSAARPDASYDIDITNVDPDTLVSLETESSEAAVEGLINIAYIGDIGGPGEYVGYEVLDDLGGGVVRLSNLYRGLFHTAPRPHLTGTRIWFIGQTGGNLTRKWLSTNDEVDLQLRGLGHDGETLEGATPTLEVTLQYLWRVPLAPRDPVLNGSYAPTSEDVDTQYTTETGRTGEDARALEAAITARSWRIDNVLDDITLAWSTPSNYLADAPEFDFVLKLDPDTLDVDVATVNISGTETPVAYILRNEVIKALGANVGIPSAARLIVTAKHNPVDLDGGVFTNPVTMDLDFTLISTLQGQELIFGGFAVNTSSTVVIFGETGTYNFDIKTALPSSGVLQANVNGGGFVTVVAASSTTGTLAITSGDSVVLRFTQAPTGDQFFDLAGPVAETGYGVLQA